MKIRDLEWWIVGILACTAFLLAMLGFNIIFTAAGVERNLLDLAFQSMKIFGMEFVDDFVSPLPWQLETARWLAPMVLLYTAAKAIIYFVRREFKSLVIKFYKEHIIITSLNEKSRYLVNDLLSKGEKVIVVAGIDSKQKLDIIEKGGAVIIAGDIDEQSFLKNISAHKAKYFMFMDEEDESNISSAINVYNFLREYESDINQELFVHVADDIKLNELHELKFFEELAERAGIKENCDVRFFSMNERTSRMLFNNYSPDIFTPVLSKEEPALNIAVIGSNDLTQSFIIRLARLGWYLTNQKINIYLFHDGQVILKKLHTGFPNLDKLVNLVPHDEPLDSFSTADFNNILVNGKLSAAYLLCKDDSLSSNILNKISKADIDGKLDVVMGLMNPEGIINKWYNGTKLQQIKLHKFNVLEESFTKDAIISVQIDALAKIIHEDYLSKLKKRDPAKQSHQEWETLPIDFKNQNREQADHLFVKLRSMNAIPLRKEKAGEVFDFTEDAHLVEQLSEMEHNRWQAHMMLNGWTYNPVRNDDKKHHTDIVPYEQLSEPVKDWDRNAVKNIPHLIGKLDMVICKNIQEKNK